MKKRSQFSRMGTMYKKTVSIVIPSYNRKDSLIRLLENLHLERTQEINWTVIVVVDGSTDGTLETLRSDFPSVTIVEGNGQWWWTHSVNEGCQLAVENGADAVLLLNDDVIPQKNYFSNLVAAAQQEPQALIGSLNLTNEAQQRIFFSGAPEFSWLEGKLHRYHPFLAPCWEHEGKLTGLHNSVVLPGRGLWIPSDVFKRIGFFDDKHLPQYKADYDFVLRAHEHHIKTLVCWDAVLRVNVETTGQGATFTRQYLGSFLGSFFKKNTRTNINQNFFYYQRHYPVWAVPLLPLTGFFIALRQVSAFLTSRKY